jgi:hypothetical protein
VPHLLAIADRVDKLLAVCRKCGSDFACRTQRLVHSSEQILVGDAQYEARCLHCFEAPYEFQLKLSLPESTQPETHHVVERATSPQLSLVEDFGPDDNVRSELVPLVNVNQR